MRRRKDVRVEAAAAHRGRSRSVARLTGNAVFGVAMAFAISGCCGIPDDPEDPAASAPGKRAQRFLDTVASRDDVTAWSMLRTDGWDSAESFGSHLDSFSILRAQYELEWTDVHYVAPRGPEPSRTLQYCLGMAPHRVEVAGTLSTPGGETITLTLTEDEREDGWRWCDEAQVETCTFERLGVRAALGLSYAHPTRKELRRAAHRNRHQGSRQAHQATHARCPHWG